MKRNFLKYKKLIVMSALAIAVLTQNALAEDMPFTLITNWYAQAEHGGFYQALAEGTYKKEGLDVTLRMGGPQVNGIQLLLARQAQCAITDDITVMQANKRNMPVKIVATSFQFNPTVIITHTDIETLEQLKSRTLLIANSAHSSWWPWAKKEYGFTDSMIRPYTFNIQPFVLNNNIAQQGYMTSEPYAMQKVGAEYRSFMLGKQGYPPYGNTLACHNDVIQKHPEKVAAFVKASMQGWKSFLADPAPASALIIKDNPNMEAAKIVFAVDLLKSSGIVTGGDAVTMGIGVITDARMKKTWEMAIENGFFSAKDVMLKQYYTTEFINQSPILP